MDTDSTNTEAAPREAAAPAKPGRQPPVVLTSAVKLPLLQKQLKCVLISWRKMVTNIHRPLKVSAFNAKGIMRQRYELSKQLQNLHVDVALFSDTHLKPLEKFIMSNYQF
jgi:hypothetical protein